MEKVQESLATPSALLSVIGEESIESHGTLEFETKSNNVKICPVLDKLEGYCMQRLTRCIKLTNFKSESINSYLTPLKYIVENGQFEDRNRQPRDHFVMAIRDTGVQERIL
ncbi:hypothetical protein P5673_010016 [Acropora cervicornis]|uniref:Uncharacterized protein n=1 Tax=Acropora cervicornis TaxID=6130 RepID=A0AAD9V9R4_ACRCE|nr:hypothetical protein P5673_010016 [Acropora cervicornis]